MNASENQPAPERSQHERRKNRRSQCWGTAGVKILPEGVLILGYLMDLSLTGCLVDADEPFPVQPGGRVETLLQLDGFTLLLAGEVVRAEDSSQMLAIRFVDVSPRKMEQIERLIAEIHEADSARKAGQAELGG